MGGIIYSGARRVHFLGGFRRAGHGGGILDWADRGTDRCRATAAASAAHAKGADIERKAGNDSACSGYRVSVLWSGIVDAGFAMLVPDVRSCAELDAKAGGLKTRHYKKGRPDVWSGLPVSWVG